MDSGSKNAFNCAMIDFKAPHPLSLKQQYSEKHSVLASVTNNSLNTQHGYSAALCNKEKSTPINEPIALDSRSVAKTPSMASSLRGSQVSGTDHSNDDSRKSSSIGTGSRRTLFGSHTSSIRSSRTTMSNISLSNAYTTPKAGVSTANAAKGEQMSMTTPGCPSYHSRTTEVPITPLPSSSAVNSKLLGSKHPRTAYEVRSSAYPDDSKSTQAHNYGSSSAGRPMASDHMARIRQMLVKFRANLVFLDGMDREQKAHLQRRVSKWGAKTADFLEKDVTLIITTGCENSGLAAVYCSKDMFQQKPQIPFTEHLRLALQARCEHSIKVWEYSKLERLFSYFEELRRYLDANTHPSNNRGLASGSSQVVAGAGNAGAQETDLVQLLTQEKLAGLPTTTSHRSKAASADWHEFQNPFILVEDALNNHKPIVVREFEYRTKYGDACLDVSAPEPRPTPWPRLYYDSLPERCPFHVYYAKDSDGKKTQPRQRRAATANGDTDAASALTMGDTNASGLHTMSTAQSTTARHLRWSHMQRRKEATFGNLKMLNIMPNSKLLLQKDSAQSPAKGRTLQSLSQDNSRNGNDGISLVSEQMGAFDTQNRSAEERHALRLRALIVYQKPGWCENCSEKYQNFVDHIKTKKHRTYATSRANFVHLDNVIKPLLRPLSKSPRAECNVTSESVVHFEPLYQGSTAQYDNTSGDTDRELEWVWREHEKTCAKASGASSSTSLSLPSDDLDEQLAAAANDPAFDSDYSEKSEESASEFKPLSIAKSCPRLKRRAPHSECGQESQMSSEHSEDDWGSIEGHGNAHLLERVKRLKRMSSSNHQKNQEVSASVS